MKHRTSRRRPSRIWRPVTILPLLPSYLLEPNPVEKYWRQLQTSLSNRFCDLLDELTTAIDTALDQLAIPDVSNYF